MSGTVIPFRRPQPGRGPGVPPAQRVAGVSVVSGLAVVIEAQPGAVCMVVGETELWLNPQEARDLARDLRELADHAEGARG